MRRTTCQRLLPAYLEGSLSGRRLRALERRLDSDESLRTELESLRAMTGALETLETPRSLDPELRDRLERRIRREAPSERRGWSLPALSPQTALAGTGLLCVALLAGLWWVQRAPETSVVARASLVIGEVEHRSTELETWEPLHEGDELPEGSQIISRDGGMVSLETTEGATVSMASGASLRIADERTVAPVQGQIYAEVRRGIRVETRVGNIVATRGEGQLAVDLEPEGAVNVAIAGFDAIWHVQGENYPLTRDTVASLAPGIVTGPNPIALDPGEWTWLNDLEHARARALLRETHPSLLPSINSERW